MVLITFGFTRDMDSDNHPKISPPFEVISDKKPDVS